MCKPINLGGHAAYQAKMITLLKQYYPDAFTRFGPSLWSTIGKFYSMDLTKIDSCLLFPQEIQRNGSWNITNALLQKDAIREKKSITC